ncbi:MAG: cytochrome c oxidase subunit II [Chloroflexi bacterium]|nr:cytochrome c oxidase subunit II [Chloroflexota bacterium]
MLPRIRLNRRLVLLLGALLLILFAAACSKGAQSTFDPKGPVARDQNDLFLLIFWLAVGVFILVEGLLVYSIIRFRRKKGDDTLPKQVHGNSKLEVFWTLIPLAIVVVIAIPTYTTIADQHSPPDGESVKVEVVGHQWWWEFRYPELGIATANELNVPTGKVIKIDMLSGDVVHSFWIPKLAGATDVFPNRLTQMWFIADDVGTYYGQCKELCGVEHALMRMRVVARTPTDFDTWAASQKSPPPAPAPGSLAAQGQQVFATHGCLLCHTTSGPEAPGTQEGREKGYESGQSVFPGPNLTYFATRDSFAGSVRDRTEDNLREWLTDPDAVKPGNHMAQLAPAYQNPDLKLSKQDIDALIAYLMSRTPAPSQ